MPAASDNATPPRRPARRHGAVGGVVVDDRNRLLLLERNVLRRGQWVMEVRLPKGKLQPRETDAAAALNEVIRLTGHDDLEIVSDLGRERVSYVHRGVSYIRQEHFFLMKLRSLMKTDPEAPRDEDARLHHIRFVEGFDRAAEQLTFPSEQDVLLRARAWW